MSAAAALSAADVAPTATRLAAARAAQAEAAGVMREWTSLSTTGLAALNAKRRAAGMTVVAPPE